MTITSAGQDAARPVSLLAGVLGDAAPQQPLSFWDGHSRADDDGHAELLQTVPVSAAPIEVAREEFLRAAASLGLELRIERSEAESVRDNVGPTVPLTRELVEFWSTATPVSVEVPLPPEFLRLFNPPVLASEQVGYDGDTWDRSWVVSATSLGIL